MFKKIASVTAAIALSLGLFVTTATAAPHNRVAPVSPVAPFVSCVSPVAGSEIIWDDGSFHGYQLYMVSFGYTNTSKTAITIPIGANNTVEPWSTNGYNQPTVFQPGTHQGVYNLSMITEMHWKLGNTEAIATRASTLCQ